MANSDSLFNLDVVRDFIISKGGKTTNHQLVTHFKFFLNDPKQKVVNRQKFKDIVNTLATVKLDENGEKVLLLRKKYRDSVAAPFAADASPSLLNRDTPRNRPKAKKSKLAGQFESATPDPPTPSIDLSMGSVVSSCASGSDDSRMTALTDDSRLTADSSHLTADSSHLTADISHLTADTSQFTTDTSRLTDDTRTTDDGVDDSRVSEERFMESEPSLSELMAGVLQSKSLKTSLEESEPAEPSTSEDEYNTPPEQLVEEETAPVIREPSPVEDEPVVEPVRVVEPVPLRVVEPAHQVAEEGRVDAVEDQEDGTDSGVGEGSVAGSMADSMADSMDGVSMSSSEATTASDQLTSPPAAEDLEHSVISVKQRAQHLNKIESQGDLLAVPGVMRKKDRYSKAVGEDDDSDIGGSVSLTDIDRKWLVDASQADYHELHRALNNTPRLSKYKDFMSGYTALHWAAKHGNTDIVKLLCGSPEGVVVNAQTHGGYSALHLASIQGHEEVIELLIQGYKADPDIRDHSGRKAKQYLKHSASTRSQQLLQPRRIHTSVAGGSTSQTTFRRVGSYNSKIRSVGGAPFGIQGGAAMRKSWTTNNAMETDRSVSPKPRSVSPSPRYTPGELQKLQKDQNMMPPPRELPLRRNRSQRGDTRENLSDSELPTSSLPSRFGSDSAISMQSETGV